MKIRLAVLLLAMFVLSIVAVAPAQAVSYTRQINPLTTVTVTVTGGSGQALAMATSASGTWKSRNASVVVKYWDDPWHKVMDYQYTVRKHWDYNVTKNQVRNAVATTEPWINAALKAKGDWSEEVASMDFYYSRQGNNNMDAHFSGRHARFHSIFGFKGFSIPIGTWYCDVKFYAFAKNRPNSNQNWACVVNQHWRYLN
jgi:hypothetical protein